MTPKDPDSLGVIVGFLIYADISGSILERVPIINPIYPEKGSKLIFLLTSPPIKIISEPQQPKEPPKLYLNYSRSHNLM